MKKEFSFLKNTCLLIIFSLCLINLHSCSSDSTEATSNTDIKEEQKEAIVENILEKINIDSDSKATSVIGNTEVQEEEMSTKKERTEIIKKQLDTSKVVKEYGQDCAAILNKYKQVITKYAKSGNDSDLDEVLNWQNDPMFIHCNKEEPYKAEFQKLNEILE